MSIQSQTPSPLSAAQCRAARALLGWNQQDLAQRANVAISTVADFERDKRTPVLNNLEAMRSAFEDAKISLLHGGVVLKPHGTAEPAPMPNAGSPIRWVDATDLDHWADRRDSQELLPELIRRLILATTRNRTNVLNFRSGDSISQTGWDGICESNSVPQQPFLPNGSSGWELTTQKEKVAQKATEDFAKRVKDPGGVSPAETTFVFATLRRWAAGAKWARARREEGKWSDVRALDADALVQWIDLFPGVGIWLASLLGKRPNGITQLSDAWEEWRATTRWRMSTEIVLAGRDDEATKVLKWLYAPPATYAVQSESPQEAMAFLYAAIGQLPDDYRQYYHSKCLVVSNPDAARMLGTSSSPLVIILDNADPGLAARLVEKGHHVFVAFGSVVGTPSLVTSLPRPPRDLFKEALLNMGIPEFEADRLARDSARSLSVLRRLIPSAPASIVPDWASPNAARTMLPALFAGAWDSAQEADRKVLEGLGAGNFEQFDAEVTRWLGVPDSPFRRAGTTWKVASPRDAWFRLAPIIRKSDLDRFVAVAGEVLATPDPRFDIEPDDRWKSSLLGKNPKHSGLLLTGLPETLLLLAIYGDQVRSVPNASAYSDKVVSDLLSNADSRRWWSVSGQLRTFAEASPDAFMQAVEDSLSRDDKPIMNLFIEDGGIFGGGAHHSNLLWALETLAWSPAYVSRVAELLARLSHLDPGGRYANRPKNSLREIFLLWHPQTHATLDERLQVLDRIRKIDSDSVWGLMRSLLPGLHNFSSPTPQPRWREFSPTANKEKVTHALIYRGSWALIDRLLDDVGLNPTRWEQLIESVPTMPPESRATVTERLSQQVSWFSDDMAREQIWKALRKLLHHHRSFPTANWALPADELDRLAELYDQLEPKESTRRLVWLFSHSTHEIPRPHGNDWEANEKAISRLRQNAVKEFFSSGGARAVVDLASSVPVPYILGIAAGEAAKSKKLIDELLVLAIVKSDTMTPQFVNGLVVSAFARYGDVWAASIVKTMRREKWPPEIALRFFLGLPGTRRTWDYLADSDPSLETEYWKTIGVHWIRGEVDDNEFRIEKLIGVGRARDAVQLIGLAAHDVNSELLVRVLEEAARQPWPENIAGNDTTMFQWGVEQIMQALDKAGDIDESRLATLEWTYLTVLEHSSRPTLLLHRAMATNPAFFLQILKAIFRADAESGVSEEEDERTQQIAAQAYRLMDSWTHVPGMIDGRLDRSALQKWMRETRDLCRRAGRIKIGDQHIGRVLAYSPPASDGIWPATEIREVIEDTRSGDLEIGIARGVNAKRGITSRGMLDGGKQERAIAQTYRDWANAVKLEWPRTSAALQKIARSFEEQARRHDEEAERTDWQQ